MRYEYIEPFVLSTVKVLEGVFPRGVTQGGHTLVRGDRIAAELAIIIRLGGDSEGSIILLMDQETARRIGNLMNQENVEFLTPLGLDALAELANVVAGNAASLLNNLGYPFKVSPPQIITSRDGLKAIPPLEAFRIPLFTECGEITMNIALRTD